MSKLMSILAIRGGGREEKSPKPDTGNSVPLFYPSLIFVGKARAYQSPSLQ
jgi:hypothetical protein